MNPGQCSEAALSRQHIFSVIEGTEAQDHAEEHYYLFTYSMAVGTARFSGPTESSFFGLETP